MSNERKWSRHFSLYYYKDTEHFLRPSLSLQERDRGENRGIRATWLSRNFVQQCLVSASGPFLWQAHTRSARGTQ
jgi:hypothetical protein